MIRWVAAITPSCGCARTALVSIVGAQVLMWSSSSQCWRVRCPIKPSRVCTTVLARRRRAATARPLGCVFLHNHRKIPPYREGAGRARRDHACAGRRSAQGKRGHGAPSHQRAYPASHQLCKGAPWVIRANDPTGENVRRAANARRLRHPPSGDPHQNALIL